RCYRDWSSDVCSSDLFEQPAALTVELNLQRKSAHHVDDFCLFNIGLGQEWDFFHRELDWVIPVDLGGFASTHGIRLNFLVEAQRSEERRVGRAGRAGG